MASQIQLVKNREGEMGLMLAQFSESGSNKAFVAYDGDVGYRITPRNELTVIDSQVELTVGIQKCGGCCYFDKEESKCGRYNLGFALALSLGQKLPKVPARIYPYCQQP